MTKNNPILRKPPKSSKPRNINDIIPKIEEKPHEYRYQLLDPTKFDKESFRYKRITKGIAIITACDKDKFIDRMCQVGLKAQSLRFDKTIFSITDAAKWISEHTINEHIT